MSKDGLRRSYGVRHERRRRQRGGSDDCFKVRTNVGSLEGVEDSPIEIIDSQQYRYGGLDPEGFDAATRKEHGDKRDDGRSDKGRVFYITAAKVVLAFAVFHVPPGPGPIILENLAVDSRLPAGARARLRRALLHCVLEASELLGRERETLAWATDDDEKVNGIEGLGFGSVTRPKSSDCKLRHYFERDFPPAS